VKPRILLIDDDRCFAETIRLVVKPLGARVDWVEDAGKGFHAVSKSGVPFDLVIIDYHLPDMKGAELAEILKRKFRDQEIVFATGDLTAPTLTALLKTGSSVSFLSKSDSAEQMRKEIEKGINAYRRGKRVLAQATNFEDVSEIERALATSGIVGCSKAMLEVLEKVNLFRAVDVDVLILGETGVGKELVAKALLRPGQKLFPVNCAAFSESSTLLESELFGHAKGSFTDAKADKPGIFEVAEGHCVFLDEIHTLTKAAQGKLLRFLQEKKIRRVGENFERDLAGKFRVICATKPSIQGMVEEGSFLPDLFYRINKARIPVPPLRERLEDLEPLVLHFSSVYGKRYGRRRLFESSVLREMEKMKWPGNVRDLENTVASLVLEAPSELVTAADFVKYIGDNIQSAAPVSTEEALPLDLARRAFEKQKILSVLRGSRTVTEAAQKLNLARTTLASRLSRLGIVPEQHLAIAK
jgi:DNA-binding NtrC family response regulator